MFLDARGSDLPAPVNLFASVYFLLRFSVLSRLPLPFVLAAISVGIRIIATRSPTLTQKCQKIDCMCPSVCSVTVCLPEPHHHHHHNLCEVCVDLIFSGQPFSCSLHTSCRRPADTAAVLQDIEKKRRITLSLSLSLSLSENGRESQIRDSYPRILAGWLIEADGALATAGPDVSGGICSGYPRWYSPAVGPQLMQ